MIISLISNAQPIKDCFSCDKKYLTEEELTGKSLEELALLRNEIYARKGYVFQNRMYQNYFEYRKWYKIAASNSDVKLSKIELQNVDLFKSLETKLQKKRDFAIRDLKRLKQAVNNNDEAEIDKYLIDLKEENLKMYYSDFLSDIKSTLNYIDLDDINWNKGRGLYKVTIDNGYNISCYQISIEQDIITITCGNQSHSEIFGDFDDGYSDYMSESESSFWWIFEMQENGIKFKHFGAAG